MANNKLPWIGTIPLFVLIIGVFTAIYAVFAFVSYKLLSEVLSFWPALAISLVTGLLLFGLFLNIPIPRKRKNPGRDLNEEDKIAHGAWCDVYMKPADSKRVVKQLYFCGWGHNDYTKHKAFVIGKPKICGKWNPVSLWFLHNYMILYQLIGLKRRLRIEHQIEALPDTYNVQYSKLRYEQKFVDRPLTVESCPSDIREQFKQLNDELERSGLYLDDVHAGNVRLTKEGKIKIVDGELYSGGEEWVKSKLVVLFNGEMVSNMEPVLGNERIVAWVDHRLRVDAIVTEVEQT